LDHCQHVRRINSIGINRIAADTWGTIYPKLLPPLQIAGKDDGPIQHQHTDNAAHTITPNVPGRLF